MTTAAEAAAAVDAAARHAVFRAHIPHT